MDFWDLTKLLARRWYFAVPMLVFTVVGVFVMHQVVKPKWIATSYVQLVPPVNQTVPGQLGADQRNPWIGMGLYTLANAAMLTVQDESVVEELNNQGLSDTFTATLGSGLPTVTFEVTASSQQAALDTTTYLITRYDKNVDSLQQNVQAADKITTRRLDIGGNLKQSNSNVKRALIAVGGAGLILSVGLTVGVDGVIRRRNRRRQVADSDDLPPAPEPQRPSRWKDPYVTGNNGTVAGAQVAPRPDSTSRAPTDTQPGRGIPTIVVSYSPTQANGRGEAASTPPPTTPPVDAPADSTVVLPLRHGVRPSGSSRNDN